MMLLGSEARVVLFPSDQVEELKKLTHAASAPPPRQNRSSEEFICEEDCGGQDHTLKSAEMPQSLHTNMTRRKLEAFLFLDEQ